MTGGTGMLMLHCTLLLLFSTLYAGHNIKSRNGRVSLDDDDGQSAGMPRQAGLRQQLHHNLFRRV